MRESKNKISQKKFLFYLSWTICFAIIPIVIIRPEKLTLGLIISAVIISAIISIPATSFFFKSLNEKTAKSEDINFDLLPEEKIIFKTNANLKNNFVMLGGILFLTNKQIIFIGAEFFDQNKTLMYLPLNVITVYECINNNQLTIKADSGKKYIFVLKKASEFHSELSNVLK